MSRWPRTSPGWNVELNYGRVSKWTEREGGLLTGAMIEHWAGVSKTVDSAYLYLEVSCLGLKQVEICASRVSVTFGPCRAQWTYSVAQAQRAAHDGLPFRQSEIEELSSSFARVIPKQPSAVPQAS